MLHYLLLISVMMHCLAHAETIVVFDNTAIVQKIEAKNILTDPKKAWDLALQLYKGTGWTGLFNPTIHQKILALDTNPFYFIPAPAEKSDCSCTESITDQPLYDGRQMPPIIQAWVKNHITSYQALTAVKAMLNEKIDDELNKIIFSNFAEILFDPEIAVRTIIPNKKTETILKALKKTGSKLILATNWNEQCFDELKKNDLFKNLYGLFDTVILSQADSYKPQETIYQKIKPSYETSDNTYISIETEPTYAKVAERCGMQSILYTNPEDLHKQLIKMGVLSEAIIQKTEVVV